MQVDKKSSLNHQAILLNIVAFSFLFVGYFLTTGTKMIESEVVKVVFRFIAMALFLRNAFFGRGVQMKFVVALNLLFISFILSQSVIVPNIMFLLLIAMSLYRLSGKEVAITFLVPTAIVVLLHLVLLGAGNLENVSTDFGERVRSTLGFANANQVSAIYLSLALLTGFAHQQFKTKASLFLLVISFVGVFVVVASTDSRTTMFAIFIFLLLQTLEFLLQRFKKVTVLLRYFAAASPFVASVATYYITTSENAGLNLLLSFRPYFFSEFVNQVKVFDLFLGWSIPENAGVDNFFLMLLSAVGVFGYFLIISIISYRVFRMKSNFIPIVIVIMIVSMFEAFPIRPEIPMAAFFVHLLLSPQMQQRYCKRQQ